MCGEPPTMCRCVTTARRGAEGASGGPGTDGDRATVGGAGGNEAEPGDAGGAVGNGAGSEVVTPVENDTTTPCLLTVRPVCASDEAARGTCAVRGAGCTSAAAVGAGRASGADAGADMGRALGVGALLAVVDAGFDDAVPLCPDAADSGAR